MLQVERQHSVEELNHGDVVVEEIVIDSSLQVKHRNDDVVGLLSQEFSYRNVVLLPFLFNSEIGPI